MSDRRKRKKMSGCLYGIGVGPGDPELMTLKACRLIRECDVIAIPSEEIETCVAYEIAKGAVPELDQKEVMCISMPMTKDKEILERCHESAVSAICGELDKGKRIGFLTLGDPTVYSTYIYVHKRIGERGYGTEIVNGIPSFCAAAARLNCGLVEGADQLHIIPASYGVEEALGLPGVKVLMKAGRTMKSVKEKVAEGNCRFQMVENCGMRDERVYDSVDDVPEQASYYSLMIVK